MKGHICTKVPFVTRNIALEIMKRSRNFLLFESQTVNNKRDDDYNIIRNNDILQILRTDHLAIT